MERCFAERWTGQQLAGSTVATESSYSNRFQWPCVYGIDEYQTGVAEFRHAANISDLLNVVSVRRQFVSNDLILYCSSCVQLVFVQLPSQLKEKGYVLTSVCLSVCLSARLFKKLRTDFDAFSEGWPNEQSIRFRWWFGPKSTDPDPA